VKTKLTQNNIPNGWSYKSLKESGVSVIDGDRGKNYPKHGDFQAEGHCLFLNASNVSKNGFNFDEMQFIAENIDNAMGKGKLTRQDLIITTRGTIGNIAFYSDDIQYDHIRINSGMAIIRNQNGKLLTKYLLKYFLSTLFIKELKRASFGSAQPQLTIQLINKFTVPHCPINEQKRIVTVLEAWDSYLVMLERKIEIKKNIKKGLMQQLLTGKRRLREFAESWESMKLSDLCKVEMGQSPPSSSYNTTQNGLPLIQGNADLMKRKTIRRIWTSSPTKLAKRDQIIMTVRAPVGFIGVAQEDVCIGRGVCAITAKKVDRAYILHHLISLERKWGSFEQGSTFTAVNGSDIRGLLLNLPTSEKEQTAIADILTKADDEIEALEQKKKIIEDQKRFLLNNLITGKIRTPESMKA
jgi:type I restriction enzyme S subunit